MKCQQDVSGIVGAGQGEWYICELAMVEGMKGVYATVFAVAPARLIAFHLFSEWIMIGNAG